MRSQSQDRRVVNRYPLEFDLTYRIFLKDKTISAGSGRTLDISSSGILFTPGESASKGSYVHLLIDWPVFIEDKQMEFSVLGQIVRQEPRGTAIRILRHGFARRGTPAAGKLRHMSDLLPAV